MNQSDNKRIAKNTFFLYIRTFVSIIVSLYTTRVVWQVLGIENYGIYNVVGGIVLMFNFLNAAMVASSQRFISFELGKGASGNLSKVFSISVRVHLILAAVILLLAETVGLWFVNCKLNIPSDRFFAANCVYQASVFSFLVVVISVPYNALIVAYERMKVYGYFGLLEVALKLAIVYMLLLIPYDKLIVYSLLVLTVSVFMRIIYNIYCKRHIPECQFIKCKDKGLLRGMFSFAGWSLIGNMGFSLRDQGLNVMLNMFFNVAMNAAKGMATSVLSVIQGFTGTFQMAVNPQITKLYASGNESGMIKLVLYSTKYSFFLLLFIAVPFFFQCGYVLNLWIGNVSDEMVMFMRLALIMALIDSMASPAVTAMQATGNIKKFQIVISLVMLSSLPLAYIWLKLNHDPYIVSYAAIITSLAGLYARLLLLSQSTQFSLKEFARKVACRVIAVSALIVPIAYYLYKNIPSTIIGLIMYCICVLIISIAVVYIVGLTKEERSTIVNQIRTKFKK
jgi:O-antigen/teichoic acid export membrane protein